MRQELRQAGVDRVQEFATENRGDCFASLPRANEAALRLDD